MKKLLSFFLCAAMIIPLFSCANHEETSETDGSGSADTETEIVAVPENVDQFGREIIPSAIPDDLKFNGEPVTIYLREAASIFGTESEFIAEDFNGEPVNDAVHQRELEVEDQLNISLEYEIAPGIDFNVYRDSVVKTHAAGDKAYDILAMYAYYSVSMAMENLLADLTKLPHLDLEKPWWNRNFVDEMTLYDQLYFISGDLSLTATECTHSIFFNKPMLESYYPGTDLYQTVDEGKWTIDYFSGLCSDIYTDLNGDGIRGDEDLYGILTHGVSIPVDAYLDAFDLAITTKNADGIPEITYNNERTVNAYGKIFDLCHNNTGSHFGPTTIDFYQFAQSKFRDSQTMFLNDIFQATDVLREMEDDYGVLPMFKYDEAQSGYYTNTADVYSLMAVASDNKDPEIAGAAFELLGQKSYELVTPAYFEIALKQKYTRDNQDAKMYDLIMQGCRYNFGFVYSVELGNMIHLWRGLLGAADTDFASSFAKTEKMNDKLLSKLLEKYQEMGTAG